MTLSISSDGHLILVDDSSSVLMIYGSNALIVQWKYHLFPKQWKKLVEEEEEEQKEEVKEAMEEKAGQRGSIGRKSTEGEDK